MMSVTESGATITLPHDDTFSPDIEKQLQVPEALTFQGPQGLVLLQGCRHRGGSFAFGGYAMSQTLIDSFRLISGVHQVFDYSQINGLKTEVEGLAQWVGRTGVTTSLEYGDTNNFKGLNLRAENVETRSLGGAFNLALDTSIKYSPPQSGGEHHIEEALFISTRTTELQGLRHHARVHRMVQDLMCLVYGQALRARALAVMRDDDQPSMIDPLGSAREWKNLYEPHFGRYVDVPTDIESRKRPMFTLADTEQGRVVEWMTDWDRWSRPTSIAVTTLFQRGTTVEADLLQVAVALEALGYEIRSQCTGRRESLNNFNGALAAIFQRVRWDWKAILGRKHTDWSSEIRVAYIGVKHADNPMPEPRAAHRLAREGMMVLRVWQAHQLGVPEEVVQQYVELEH